MRLKFLCNKLAFDSFSAWLRPDERMTANWIYVKMPAKDVRGDDFSSRVEKRFQ